MSEQILKSPGVSAREIDLSQPGSSSPQGIPACVIGTAQKGPAFVPITFASYADFRAKFGGTDAKLFGPIAVSEWLKNAQSATYVRVLGAGDAKKANSNGTTTNAGFVVGSNLPQAGGNVGRNIYATDERPAGRTYFLSAFMNDKEDGNGDKIGYLTDAGLSGSASTSDCGILRACILVASGVRPALSGWDASELDSVNTTTTLTSDAGHEVGAVNLNSNGDESFVMFLNGFTNTNTQVSTITASMNPLSKNYFKKVLNTDPTKLEEKGHYLYAYFDVHPNQATIAPTSIAYSAAENSAGYAHRIMLQSGSYTRNTFHSSQYKPNFENFEDKFKHAESPWVISQTLGSGPKNIFKIHALDAGEYANTLFKISIANIKKSSDVNYDYGQFDLLVRAFDDTDAEPQILEKFVACNLDPSSDRYIARVIGDQNIFFDFEKQEANQKLVIEGLYANKSQYIRVQVVDDVENGVMEATALPFGFRGKKHLVLDGVSLGALDASATTGLDEASIDGRVFEPPVPMRKTLRIGQGSLSRIDTRLYWGVQNTMQGSVLDPNANTTINPLISNFTKYFPSFGTYSAFVGDNPGVAADTDGAILDCDSYNNNIFTLERVWAKCKSGNTANAVDHLQWHEAVYIRSGSTPTANSGTGYFQEDDGSTAKTAANGYRFLDYTKDFGEQASKKFMKFTFFMQGGFDGLNIFRKDMYELSNNQAHREALYSTTTGYGTTGPTIAAYRKALDIIAEKSDVDIQLLAIPGIREPSITDYAIDQVENRFDALYVMDIEEEETSAGTVVTSSLQNIDVTNTSTRLSNRVLDTSFAAAYFPDVIIQDPDSTSNIQAPPSCAVLGAMSLNDAVAHPWFAPAGFARGTLASTIEAQVKLNRANMDSLYEVDINPIVAFPTSPGVVVFGQKTLLQAQSALDRVNVRRLLIDIRRKVRLVANSILFEPNRESTLARFSASVQPILTVIQQQQGLDKFKVVIDTTTTSQQDVENNTIRGKIFLQPTRAVEFISLDFVVTNAGAEI